MGEDMRSMYVTLRGPSVLQKIEQNRAALFRTRFTTISRSEIHTSLKANADALNRRRCGFLLRCKIRHIRRGEWRRYARKCACVYNIWNV